MQTNPVSRCGEIKRLVMGLDRYQKTPCGFCFVEYYTHQDALDCMKYIGGTKLDERAIRTDLDPGFQEGRQYGYEFYLSINTESHDDSDKCSGEANLVAKFGTSIATNMIQAEEDMEEPSTQNARRKKKNTAREDSLSQPSLCQLPESGLLS